MEYNKDSLKQLLNQVHTINESYKIVRKNTGEDFNLFQILGMETAEVKTHSKFLAELLNPKGSHLQGNVFLKIFIEYLNNVKINDENNDAFFLNEDELNLNFEKSTIQVEKYIGIKTQDTGGRIDIAIEDTDGRLICIENKIYAGEQENQLLRYYNYGKKFKKCHLLFLTLDGQETATIDKEVGKAYPISYKKHIIEWLELCKKEAVNLPILRETIGQYINLIKKLTHQTTNKDMERDLNKLVLKNYTESKLIYGNFEESVYILYNNIIDDLSKRLKTYLKEDHPDWELYHIGKIQSTKDRGNLFIQPKNIKKIGGFGIEEFNPLCKHHHFNHKIFYGIINWNEDIKFLELAGEIEENNKKGCWINYAFPESKAFEFSSPTETHISKLVEDSKQEQFANEIFINFKNYFEKYQNKYLQYLNSSLENESLENIQ